MEPGVLRRFADSWPGAIIIALAITGFVMLLQYGLRMIV